MPPAHHRRATGVTPPEPAPTPDPAATAAATASAGGCEVIGDAPGTYAVADAGQIVVTAEHDDDDADDDRLEIGVCVR